MPDPRPLTPKQAAFCGFVAQGQDRTEAYRRAYDAKNMLESSVRTESSRLAKLAHVAAAIQKLKDNHRPTQRTVENLKEDWIVERLEAESLDESNPSSSRIRALEQLAKIRGLYESKPEIVEQRSVEQLEKELVEKLKRLLGDPKVQEMFK